MRLICNGEALDLTREARMALKKLNPLFAFDKLTCERTTEIALPATATNDRVFMLSKFPAYTGEGMRRKFPAQLQEGTCTKDGYLYVSGYNNGAYKAIFVTGELVGLQDINGAGKLPEIITCNETVLLNSQYEPLPAHDTETWARVAYHANYYGPSILVRALVDKVVTQRGLRPIILPEAANKLRIIPATLNRLANTSASIICEISDPTQPTAQVPTTVYNSAVVDGITGSIFTAASKIVSTLRLNVDLFYRYNQVVPLQKINIIIPEDWPEDRYIIGFTEDYLDATFYGDRSFTKVWNPQQGRAITTREGEPLAGRTVTINAGTPFLVVTEDEYDCDRVTIGTTVYNTLGWNFQAYSIPITLEGSGTAELGETIRLQDNLPEITFVDLLKTIAAATNTVLNYTDADGITFEPVNVDTWPVVDITKQLQSVGDISRTFGDYAQRNIVRFDSDESVPEAQRITAIYIIDNDNLQAETDLQVIPFSEGSQILLYGYKSLYVEDINEKNTLADANAPADFMARVELKVNQGIQALCSASTKTVVKVWMNLDQYERIDQKTKLLANNTEYVWVESNWQNDIATFTLAKI